MPSLRAVARRARVDCRRRSRRPAPGRARPFPLRIAAGLCPMRRRGDLTQPGGWPSRSANGPRLLGPQRSLGGEVCVRQGASQASPGPEPQCARFDASAAWPRRSARTLVPDAGRSMSRARGMGLFRAVSVLRRRSGLPALAKALAARIQVGRIPVCRSRLPAPFVRPLRNALAGFRLSRAACPLAGGGGPSRVAPAMPARRGLPPAGLWMRRNPPGLSGWLSWRAGLRSRRVRFSSGQALGGDLPGCFLTSRALIAAASGRLEPSGIKPRID